MHSRTNSRLRKKSSQLHQSFMVESLEDRILLSNLKITDVSLGDRAGGSFNKLSGTVLEIGQKIGIWVDYQVEDVTSGTNYEIEFEVDGVVLNANTSAGTGSGISDRWWFRSGWFNSPGSHSVTVRIDPDNLIVEDNENDNEMTFNFSGVSATVPQKFLFPVDGIPWKDWTISNYVDIDPTGTDTDYQGNSITYDGHDSLDISLPNFSHQDAGRAILAAAGGTVISVHDGEFDRHYEFQSPAATGNHVIIDHGNGWLTKYWHFREDSITVGVNDVVTQGQMLGYVGSSGNSTAAHLHFNVEHNGMDVETSYDPSTYWIAPLDYTLDSTELMESGITNTVPTEYLIKERIDSNEVFDQSSGQTTYHWATFAGLNQDDQVQFIWKRPNGNTWTTSTFTISGNRGRSIWYSTRSLPTVPDLGAWKVEIRVNGSLLGETTFEVVAGGAPEIRVDSGGDYIVDGRKTPLEFANTGGNPSSRVFTVTNHGQKELKISSLELPVGFRLKTSLDTTIAAGASDTFEIEVNPHLSGSFSGEIKIYSDDASEAIYNFAVEAVITGAASTTDIVGRANGNLWTAVSDGSQFTTAYWGNWSDNVVWENVQSGDFNGDGRMDQIGRTNGNLWVALSTGSSFQSQFWGKWSATATWEDILVADFTGDGRDDFAGRSNGKWWVAVSTGSSFVNQHWGTWSNSATWKDVLAADVTGDGRADITGRASGNHWVAVSTGSGFQNQYWGRWSNGVTWNHVQLADVNGDGRADLIGQANGNWWVGISTGTTYKNQYWGKWSTSVTWEDVRKGDFNGDGRMDLIGRANGNLWVALSTGTGFQNQFWGNWSGTANWVDIQIGDFNGDGRADLAGRTSGNWWVAISTGTQFQNSYWGKWSNSVFWNEALYGNFT